jgi:hypothetical protein
MPLLRVLRNGKQDGGIMFVRNKNKPEGMWLTNFAYPLRNQDGKIMGAFAILKEIQQASHVGLPTLWGDSPPLPL